MSRTVIGTVTQLEKEQIERLFNRKSGLVELVKSLTINDFVDEEGEALYEKIITDMGETSIRFQQWWDAMQAKYEWPAGVYTIDFATNEIYIT